MRITLAITGVEAAVMAQRPLPGVALHVGLIDHVQAELVAELREVLGVRIVRSAHSIQVGRLDHHEIGTGVLHTHRPAAQRIVLVHVHAT
ncbi:MAG: hypothetical protein M5U19_21935 [Microthrixaceae bacterium]|nr:hypothetical protein [Microthrixaceae bacterium]